MRDIVLEEGWGKPALSYYNHYFHKGRSLCKTWNWESERPTLRPEPGSQRCIHCMEALNSEVKHEAN